VTTVRRKFRPARQAVEKARDDPGRGSRADRPARRLALAYYIDRLIEAGEVASYGEVARMLGLVLRLKART